MDNCNPSYGILKKPDGGELMRAIAKNGVEAWVSRREMLGTGIAAWAIGAVLALAAGLYASHASYPSAHVHAVENNAETTAEPASEDTAGASQPVVMPPDTVIAPRPSAGVTEMQPQ
jgi:hypothetical protein